MSEKLNVRNLSPIMQMFRNFVLGRKHIPERATLRYTPLVSPRTQPQPSLPGGSADKMSANYYYTRDGRREQVPPSVVFENASQKQISSGSKGQVSPIKKKPITPGKYWAWD